MDNQKDKFPSQLLIILIVFGIAMIAWQLLICKGACTIGDMHTYVTAWGNLCRLHPDPMRPPIYPILLGSSLDIFGEQLGGCFMMIIHWSVWIAGCRWCWLILREFDVSKTISSLIVILLMLFPGTWVLNNMLQTDGLATGGMALFIWQLIQYRNTHKQKWIILSGMLLIAYLFLKPQFIFLLPIWGIAWVYVSSKDRGHQKWALGVCVTAITAVIAYQGALYYCYRQPYISKVSPVNNYYSLRMAGLIYPDEIEDSVARETLRPFIEADPGTDLPDHYLYWTETWRVHDKTLNQIWHHAYSLHRPDVHSFILHRFPQLLNYNIFYKEGKHRQRQSAKDIAYYNVSKEKINTDQADIIYGKDLFKATTKSYNSLIYPLYGFMQIPFWFAWFTIASFSIWYCIKWAKEKQFPVVAFLMASIIFGGYLVVIIGAPSDWGRLVTPFSMILFSMVGILYTNVKKTLSDRGLTLHRFA